VFTSPKQEERMLFAAKSFTDPMIALALTVMCGVGVWGIIDRAMQLSDERKRRRFKTSVDAVYTTVRRRPAGDPKANNRSDEYLASGVERD
jgi:hypothetical protein